MRNHGSILGIGALALLVIASTATSAQANPSSTPPPPTEEEALGTDAATLQAVGYDMSVEDVRLSNEFNKLAAEMYLEYPDNFSTAVFDDEEGSGPQIVFSGDVPAAAQERIDGSGIKLTLTSNSGISESERSEIDAMLAESVASVQESTKCTEGAIITVSPEDGSAEVRTPCAALPEALKAQWSSQRMSIPEVDFEFDKSAVPEPEVMSGGTQLTGSENCTAGFTVRNARTGQKGITTAGHCVDNLKYEGTTQLTLQGYGDPLQMDFQWHTANRTVWS